MELIIESKIQLIRVSLILGWQNLSYVKKKKRTLGVPDDRHTAYDLQFQSSKLDGMPIW